MQMRDRQNNWIKNRREVTDVILSCGYFSPTWWRGRANTRLHPEWAAGGKLYSDTAGCWRLWGIEGLLEGAIWGGARHHLCAGLQRQAEDQGGQGRPRGPTSAAPSVRKTNIGVSMLTLNTAIWCPIRGSLKTELYRLTRRVLWTHSHFSSYRLANKQDKMNALLGSELIEILSLEKLVNQSRSLCHIVSTEWKSWTMPTGC